MFVTFITVLAWALFVFDTAVIGSLFVEFSRLPVHLQNRATITVGPFVSITWVVSFVWLLTYYVFS